GTDAADIYDRFFRLHRTSPSSGLHGYRLAGSAALSLCGRRRNYAFSILHSTRHPNIRPHFYAFGSPDRGWSGGSCGSALTGDGTHRKRRIAIIENLLSVTSSNIPSYLSRLLLLICGATATDRDFRL